MTEDFLIGTYTNKTSQGIYRVTLEDNHLTTPRLAVRLLKPSYLQVGNNHLVYTIKKGSDGRKGVAIYQLNGEGPANAQLVQEALFTGPSPAYVGVNEQRHLLFGANYHGSRVDVFDLGSDNRDLHRVASVVHTGKVGPRPEQNIPHVHYADVTPDGRLITCDLGLDLVTIYDIGAAGTLTEVSRYQTTPGFGPRHLAFHPNGRVAYLLGELSSELEVLKYDAGTAQLTPVQKLKTIPASWTKHNGAGAIRISSDGHYVYTSNRGENTIAVYRVGLDQTLQHVQSIDSQGDFPRDFNFSQNEDFLVVANQNTDNLTLYQRDQASGKLTLLQAGVPCPEPICVQRY
ncbi:lactonase family protein [Limosilactobacillus sp.]|uniref:lactonase family protein n=1 Tax=Limosilactobacillus sp. TaxID=2773925 RepID=UPI003EFD7A7C